jgi:hypothetical protein
MSGLDLNALLARLSLQAANPGAWSGESGWSQANDLPLANVRNPADGTLIAQVRPASEPDYEAVMRSAVAPAQ